MSGAPFPIAMPAARLGHQQSHNDPPKLRDPRASGAENGLGANPPLGTYSEQGWSQGSDRRSL